MLPPDAQWSTDTDGAGPDSLDFPLSTTVGFRLRNFGGAHVRAVVSLATHTGAPSKNFGTAFLTLESEDGKTTKLWSGMVGFGSEREVDVALPEVIGDAILRLGGLSAPWRRGGPGPHRIRWAQPTLTPPALPRVDVSLGALRRTVATSRPRAGGSPLFSLLTPVHNPEPQILEETLASVRGQAFQDWELVLVDDASTDPRVIEILERAAADEPRIHLIRRDVGGGISVATNTALEAANGTYVALLDHDDVLAPEALQVVADELERDPSIDMVYSDEDIFDGERRVALFRKPNWSPDLLRSHMYTCHLGVYRRSLAAEIGGFRSVFDGSQDHDFVLRFTERTTRIVHTPRVLYHWRSHAGSAADNPIAKPQAAIAGRNAIADQLDRNGISATANFASLRSWYRVDYSTEGIERVAVVVPLVGLGGPTLDHLRAAANSWLRQPGVEVEIIATGEASQLELTVPHLREALGDRLTTVETDPDLGRAAVVNRAVAATSADQLVLFDEPLEVLTGNWVGRLSSFAAQPGVGAVGAKILAADGSVDSAGVVLRDGLPMPIGHRATSTEFGPLALLQVSGNLSGFVGAVAISRQEFDELGRLREELNATATVDLCLRARVQGHRVVGAPDVLVRRLPGVGQAPDDLTELAEFRALWGTEGADDPCFNPALAAVLSGIDVP